MYNAYLVNYATLIALLAAMSFSLPVLLKLERQLGIERNAVVLFSLAVVVFIWVWLYLRWRGETEEVVDDELLPHEPYLPEIFFKNGVFLGERYKNEGNYQEALNAYELYTIVLERQGRKINDFSKDIKELKELMAAEAKEGLSGERA